MGEKAQRDTLTREDCIARARDLAPRVRERCARTERERRLSDETIAEIIDSGLVRALAPKRHGGSELSFNVTLDVCLELGRACASTAWLASFFMTHAWVVGLFPRAAQDEVWGPDPNALIATRVSLHGNHFIRTAEGILLSGSWPQTSGVAHTAWLALCAGAAEPHPGSEILFALVPKRDVTILDTWFASGLRGSGSNTVVAERVFVPWHRTIGFRDFLDGTCPGGREPGASPLYRLPASGGYMGILSGPILGAAYGALEDCAQAARRTSIGPGSLGPAHQLSLAEAAAELDGAQLLLSRHFQDAMATVAAGFEMTRQQRARGRREGAYATRVANRALTRLLDSATASVLYESSPVQRAWRDIRVMSAHPSLSFDAASELWTSVTYDLELPPFAALTL